MLEEHTKGRDNNLNLVRFILAILVIYSHSFPLSLGGDFSDPFKRWLGFALGDFAVNAFFTISGFLIARSFIQRKSLGRFGLARVARIYPALFVAVVFCIVPVGLSQTSLSTPEYFAEKLTRNFLVKDCLLIPGKMQFSLPGVFEDVPYPNVVNGSLWTLPYEVSMYVAIAAVGLLGFLKRRIVALALCLAIVVAFIGDLGDGSHAIRLGAFGAVGVVMYLFQSQIRIERSVFGLLSCAGIAMSLLGYANLGSLILGSYCVLWLGFVPGGTLRSYNKVGDYSYGMYIFAYPIQQTVVNLFPAVVPSQMFVVSTLATLPLAVLSWHFVERPVLQKVRKRNFVPEMGQEK
ncbi:acyltransferase family protein [Rhodopirellula bahusiensis]|uniref:acyltransferase family protein n=1 Tax=Rhodopirellula bahusiensis TaxID=2014065 RepID=UPI0013041017|nr:acyltransferase [Rhodopirellula bahusiensis]